MSVSAGHAKIKNAGKQLAVDWNGVKLYWNDENCRKFEEKYIDPLTAKLRAAEAAMGHINMILEQVRRDCQ